MQKVIIIGASSGIGAALAHLYANNHCLVGVTGRREILLNNLKEQFPKNVITATFDVTGNENSEHLNALIEQMGGMDLLIYCSGYGEISKDLDLNIETHTVSVNVKGFIEIACIAYNYFLSQGHGHLVGISSIASIKGSSRAPAYAASKAFMSNYLEGLWLKARRENINIHITDIQPGFVDTALAKGTKVFWAAPPEKAAQQIFTAIQKKKRRVYITKRWAIIANVLKLMPHFIYKRFG